MSLNSEVGSCDRFTDAAAHVISSFGVTMVMDELQSVGRFKVSQKRGGRDFWGIIPGTSIAHALLSNGGQG